MQPGLELPNFRAGTGAVNMHPQLKTQ